MTPPEEKILNNTVVVGADEVGSAEGDAVDGADVVGVAVGPGSRHVPVEGSMI